MVASWHPTGATLAEGRSGTYVMQPSPELRPTRTLSTTGFQTGRGAGGGVAQWLKHRNSNPKSLGSIPWRSRVRDNFFLSLPSQLLCRLVCICLCPISFMCTARTSFFAHVKDPISICRTRVGRHSRWYGNTKTLHTDFKSWAAPYYGCSLSPGKRSPGSNSDPKDEGSNPVRSTHKKFRVKNGVLTRCRYAQLPCEHARTRMITYA